MANEANLLNTIFEFGTAFEVIMGIVAISILTCMAFWESFEFTNKHKNITTGILLATNCVLELILLVMGIVVFAY